jgi:hypothetical protein
MVNDKTQKIYLSRRNLTALLAKLDADAAGIDTACTIIKNRNPDVAAYQQTMSSIAVIAVQDEEYYGAQQRPAGEMHPREEVQLEKPSTGVAFGGPLL